MTHAVGKKKNVLEGNKNRYGTLWDCFYDAQTLYGKDFKLDVAAEPASAKCERFYISPDWWNARCHHQRVAVPHTNASNNRIVGFDGLQGKWGRDWWCNPPFDHKIDFIRMAVTQAKDNGFSGMMMLPYEPCTGWFRREVKRFATVVYEPDGRYQFYNVDGVTKKTGVNFPSCFVLFTPHHVHECITVPFERGIGKI